MDLIRAIVNTYRQWDTTQWQEAADKVVEQATDECIEAVESGKINLQTLDTLSKRPGRWGRGARRALEHFLFEQAEEEEEDADAEH